MGLFKPKYLKEELPEDVRYLSLRSEKNPKKLRAVFENQKMPFKFREYALQEEKDKDYLAKVVKNQSEFDNIRSYALNKLNDLELCKWVLMNPKYNPSLSDYDMSKSHNILYALYFDAAQKLNHYQKQDTLKEIYKATTYDGIKDIVLQYITDEHFLYDVSMGEDGKRFVKVAIKNINDNVMSKNIALHNEGGAKYAIEKLNDQDCLKEVVLKVKDPHDRIRAIDKIKDPSSLIEPLKKELLPVIQEDLNEHYLERELLAKTGDKTGRIILYCTLPSANLVSKLKIHANEILESDLNITYPIIKKLIASLIEDHSDRPMDNAPALKECIKVLYENGLKEEIEKEIPKVIRISGEYRDYYGDGYEKSTIESYQQDIELY